MAKKKENKEHYVNNKEFNLAVVDYKNTCIDAQSKGEEEPIVTEYIGSCLLKIAEGLSHRPNFIHYSYREEMVSDAVENCLKAIKNFDITKPTRTGLPNAFSYFTQISWYAFLRRISKEKKQQQVKDLMIECGDISEFFDDDGEHGDAIVQRVRSKNDSFKDDTFEMKMLGKRTYNKVFKGGDLTKFF